MAVSPSRLEYCAATHAERSVGEEFPDGRFNGSGDRLHIFPKTRLFVHDPFFVVNCLGKSSELRRSVSESRRHSACVVARMLFHALAQRSL